MSKSTAAAGIVARTQEVRFTAVLPRERGLPYSVMFRIDEVLSPSEIQDVVETANDIVGVMKFGSLADQQVHPHTMFRMVVSPQYDEREVYEVIDQFHKAVNADYLAQRSKQHSKIPVSAPR